MTDYWSDRISLNKAPGMTANTDHGVTGGGIIRSDPNPGEDSGMAFEVIAIPNDTEKGSSVAEFPSQNADTDFSKKNTTGNPMSR